MKVEIKNAEVSQEVQDTIAKNLAIAKKNAEAKAKAKKQKAKKPNKNHKKRSKKIKVATASIGALCPELASLRS